MHLDVLSQLVIAVSKVKDLQGLKSREMEAPQPALFAGFASCQTVLILYSPLPS